MKEIKAIINSAKLSAVIDALHRIPGMPGITVSTVEGYGKSPIQSPQAVPNRLGYTSLEMSKIEIVVPDVLENSAVDAILKTAKTGRVGDGKIYIYDVCNVIKIRTGEKGEKAI